MRKWLLFLLLLLWLPAHAQQSSTFREYGYVYGPENVPLQYIIVEVVDNPGLKTTTNYNGFYELRGMKEGGYLRLSDPQDRVQEKVVKIEGRNTYIINMTHFVSPLLDIPNDTIGVFSFDNDSPVLDGSPFYSIHAIGDIRRTGNTYTIIPSSSSEIIRYRVDFHSSISLLEVGKLPEGSSGSSPRNFFRTGISYKNMLSMKGKLASGSVLSGVLTQQKDENPLPGSYREGYNAMIRLSDLQTGAFRTSAGILAKTSYERLMNSEGSYARLLYAALNGETNVGSLTERLPDNRKDREILAYLKTDYKRNKIFINAEASFDKNWENQNTGSVNQERNYHRKEQLSHFAGSFNSSYHFQGVNSNEGVTVNAGYAYNRTESRLDRRNNSPSDNYTLDFYRFRNAHDVNYGFNLKSSGNTFKVSNKHYFSNTAKDYINIFPSAGVTANLTSFLYDQFDWYNVNDFLLYASFSRLPGESPFIYRNHSVLTTGMRPGEALTNFYNTRDIIASSQKLSPEIYHNFEVGLQTKLVNNKLHFTFTYFNNTTHNFTAPVATAQGNYHPANIGRLRNYGVALDTKWKIRGIWNSSYQNQLELNFNISHIKNRVTYVSGGQSFVPLGGFSNVSSRFVKDEPLGVIYGTRLTTDGKTETARLGDPTPDFRASFMPSLRINKLLASFVLEYSHGGDRWNGTKAMLEQQRINSTDLLMAADYMEDASFLRMSQLQVNYVLTDNTDNFIKKMTIGLQGNNLFVLTPYKGSDPESTLFGYATGKGLDLFNMPSVRSYLLTLNIEF